MIRKFIEIIKLVGNGLVILLLIPFLPQLR